MKKFGFGRKKESSGPDANPYAAQPADYTQSSQSVDNPYANQPVVSDYASSVPSARPGPAPAAGRFQPSGRVGLPGGPRVGGGLPSGPGPRNGGYGAPPPPYSGAPSNTAYDSEKYSASSDYGGSGYGQDSKPDGYGGNGYSQNNAAFAANQSRTPSASGQSYGSFGVGPGPQSRYNNNPSMGSQSNLQGSAQGSGYGGMGPPSSSRQELFAGVDRQQASGRNDSTSTQRTYMGSDQSYGGYGEQRELTEEELQQQDLRTKADEINALRDESLASADRTNLALQQMIDTGGSILQNLGSQGDRLHNTKANLNLAREKNRAASEEADRLKVANRSMFRPNFSMPGKSKQRDQQYFQALEEQHQADRAAREAIRRNQYSANQNFQNGMRDIEAQSRPQQLGIKKMSEEHNAKFAFEEEGSDEETQARNQKARDDEALLEGKLGQMQQQMNVVQTITHNISRVVDEQNGTIDEINELVSLTCSCLQLPHALTTVMAGRSCRRRDQENSRKAGSYRTKGMRNIDRISTIITCIALERLYTMRIF
jgi:protein transport protein SEC9